MKQLRAGRVACKCWEFASVPSCACVCVPIAAGLQVLILQSWIGWCLPLAMELFQSAEYSRKRWLIKIPFKRQGMNAPSASSETRNNTPFGFPCHHAACELC